MRRLRLATVTALLALSCAEPLPARPPGHGADGAAGAGGGGSGDAGGGGHPPGCDGTIEVLQEGCLDFGCVSVGREASLEVLLRNPGARPLAVCGGTGEGAFAVRRGRTELLPGAKDALVVSFLPQLRGLQEGTLPLASCPSCPEPLGELCVRGHAEVDTWALEPSPLQFGEQEPGVTVCRDITVHATCDRAIWARDIHLDDGLTRTPGTFELKLGGILNEDIPPGGAATFQLCFTPAKAGAEYSGNVVVYTENQVQKLAVAGQGKA